jgi:hypothetical protein
MPLIPLCSLKIGWGEPMGAPATFAKQIEIKLLDSASALESRIQVINHLLKNHKAANSANQCLLSRH